MLETGFQNDWPTLKGNNLRSSQSPLPGQTRSPKVLAKKQFGNYRGYFKLLPSSGDLQGDIPISEDVPGDYQAVEEAFQFNGLFYQVNGETIQRHDGANDRLFHLYGPDKLNMISVSEGLELHNGRNGMKVYKVLDAQLHTELLWEVEFPYYIERPHILVTDMNGDGVLDIVVEGWAGIVVYNSVTREKIMDFPQELLHNSRKRGYVMARDLEGNGFPDIVILSCYPWDVNVVANDGKTLQTKWFQIFDNHIESAQVISRYTRLPVFDYDGDGRMEMVFNLWNQQGDGQWHFKMLDALTGEERLDLPKAYLVDAADVDGDGKLELFLTEPEGIDVPEFSTLSVHHLEKGVIFTEAKGKWGCWCDSIPDDTLALHPSQNPRPGLISLVRGPEMSQFYYYIDTGTGTQLYRASFPQLQGELVLDFPRGERAELIRVLPDDGLLLRWETKNPCPKATKVCGGHLVPLCWGIPENQKISLPIIAKLGEKANSILLANGVGQVACFDFQEDSLQERWAVDGYGAAEQYRPDMDFGVVADSFLGNGKNQVAVRVNGRGGGIKLVDENGEEVWTTEFPSIPSGEPCSFQGILGFYTSAKSHGKTYLVVSGQRNVQHTGITFGLDGETGKELWMLDTLNKDQWYRSGAGSFYLTAWDADGDGCDEVMTGYGNNIWAAHADTGEVLFENFMRGFWESLWIKEFPSGWVSSISPIPLERQGKQSKFFFGNAGDSHGAAQLDLSDPRQDLHEKCKLLWGNAVHDYENRTDQCLLDVQGKTVVAEPAVKDGLGVIHLVDPLTGEELGTPHPTGGAAPAAPLACDIDGDGQQEIVYTSGKTLAALRFGADGWQELFQLEFDHRLSWPIYGDINGDGFGELVVTDSAGMLYVIR